MGQKGTLTVHFPAEVIDVVAMLNTRQQVRFRGSLSPCMGDSQNILCVQMSKFEDMVELTLSGDLRHVPQQQQEGEWFADIAKIWMCNLQSEHDYTGSGITESARAATSRTTNADNKFQRGNPFRKRTHAVRTVKEKDENSNRDDEDPAVFESQISSPDHETRPAARDQLEPDGDEHDKVRVCSVDDVQTEATNGGDGQSDGHIGKSMDSELPIEPTRHGSGLTSLSKHIADVTLSSATVVGGEDCSRLLHVSLAKSSKDSCLDEFHDKRHCSEASGNEQCTTCTNVEEIPEERSAAVIPVGTDLVESSEKQQESCQDSAQKNVEAGDDSNAAEQHQGETKVKRKKIKTKTDCGNKRVKKLNKPRPTSIYKSQHDSSDKMHEGTTGSDSDRKGTTKKTKPRNNIRFQCPGCERVFVDVSSGITHITSHHSSEQKFKEFLFAADEERYEYHKKKVKPDVENVECPFCGRQRAGRPIIHHLRLCHKDEFNVNDIIAKFEKNLTDCYQLRRLKRERQFHRKLIEEGRLHRCRFCDQEFNHRTSAVRHERSCEKNPAGKKRYRCRVCQKYFDSQEQRDEHQATHPSQDKFVCDICGNIYRHMSSVTVHKRKVHKVAVKYDIKYFDCEQCDKRFYTRSQLKCHMLSHSDEKCYTCEICGKGFKTENVLTDHKARCHDFEYRYKCERCGHGLGKKAYLKRHRCGYVRKVHPGEHEVLKNTLPFREQRDPPLIGHGEANKAVSRQALAPKHPQSGEAGKIRSVCAPGVPAQKVLIQNAGAGNLVAYIIPEQDLTDENAVEMLGNAIIGHQVREAEDTATVSMPTATTASIDMVDTEPITPTGDLEPVTPTPATIGENLSDMQAPYYIIASEKNPPSQLDQIPLQEDASNPAQSNLLAMINVNVANPDASDREAMLGVAMTTDEGMEDMGVLTGEKEQILNLSSPQHSYYTTWWPPASSANQLSQLMMTSHPANMTQQIPSLSDLPEGDIQNIDEVNRTEEDNLGLL